MEGNNNVTCKVVLVGDAGVGKTCIIQRYVNDNYDENTESSISSTYTYKVVEYKEFNKSISFDIWDTAGQELYRAMSKNFYLNASIGILVYDIRRKDSFNSIKDYWYEQLKSSGEDNMIFGVAGNKCDLFDKEEFLLLIYPNEFLDTSKLNYINFINVIKNISTRVINKPYIDHIQQLIAFINPKINSKLISEKKPEEKGGVKLNGTTGKGGNGGKKSGCC